MNIVSFAAAAAALSALPTAQPSTLTQHEHHHDAMASDMGMVVGALGNYSMTLDGSGTAWNPAASPMYMIMLPQWGRFNVGLMGMATLNFTDQGGPRGDSQFFSNSMAMLMVQRETGGGILTYRGMFSLDPVFNGKRGYPLLFQTGETANGEPLVDRQHPHDLISELSASYAVPIASRTHAFGYAAFAGEPASGDVMYLHRPSSGDNPEAPITHHWFDSTHITYGVLTGGITWADKWKLDASWFNGSEPDENRFDIDRLKLNSASARVEFNPTREWSLSTSYAYLHEPEALEPGVDVNRFTAAVQYQRRIGKENAIGFGAFFGQNAKHGEIGRSINIEGSYVFGANNLFARYEQVDKDELLDVPPGTYNIQKLSVGASHNFLKRDGLEFALAGQLSFYHFPSSLEPYYGSRPVSFGIFLRMRPERMH